jgi:glycerol-3-phosphate dehydrogenase
MNREQNINRLQEEEFDLCIIGGGASGAGCALDAALRGLKVALVERDDFASATSSRSTKLIHGGVRYLEQAFKNFDFAQLKQVQHGLQERHIVLANAPHLSRPLALITPVFNWWEGLYYSIGLKMYDWFAAKKDILPKSKWLSKAAAMERIPGLHPKINSAVLYYDGQLDDARYALALIQSAQVAGAVVANHLQVVDFQRDSNGVATAAVVVSGIAPNEQFVIRAKRFLNCTGPFADFIRQKANPAIAARIRPSKGVHLTLPGAVLGESSHALLIPKTPDGRVVYAIPFKGYTMVGTTDQDYDDLSKEPTLERSEVDFILSTLKPFMARAIDRSEVKAGFGGLRPLIASTKANTKGLVRDHEVEHDPKSGLFSLLGGKWTTYRLMAKDAVDAVCDDLNITAECTTEFHQLVGSHRYHPDDWHLLQEHTPLDDDICRHLNDTYGDHAIRLLEIIKHSPALQSRLVPGQPYIGAQVAYSAQAEMCCTIRDFLARRIRLEMTDWQLTIAAAPQVGSILGNVLGWDELRTQQEIDEYVNLLQGFVKSSVS